jgi:hypothetical protein
MPKQTKTIEQQAFDNFQFKLGQLVTHRATGDIGVISNRILIEAPTGNTGHVYYVSHANGYIRRFEIELGNTDAG